ncbi:multiubiquitin domain-containing protein [Sinomonas sp. P47F7]|uniref:multiubiquitin domain-containing protein n=1 Tax=Sinomonas sp. P47F7 TaxID=3410987 RepID=UPI003BF606D8
MAEEAAPKPDKSFNIIVNNNQVPVTNHSLTGLQIKQAAINAGVQIEIGFQLAEIKNKKRKIIGDNDTVGVSEGSQFVATAGDDNS